MVTRTRSGLGLGGAEQLRGCGVVEGLGQRMVLAREVAGGHRHPGWPLVPAPFIDPDEDIRSVPSRG